MNSAYTVHGDTFFIAIIQEGHMILIRFDFVHFGAIPALVHGEFCHNNLADNGSDREEKYKDSWDLTIIIFHEKKGTANDIK